MNVFLHFDTQMTKCHDMKRRTAEDSKNLTNNKPSDRELIWIV